MTEDFGGFARVYAIELLYRQAPHLRKPAVLRALRIRCPAVQPLDADANDGLLAFIHPDHPVELRDATIAAQILITPAEKPPASAALEPALQQSWTFTEARSAVKGVTQTILFTDVMASGLEPQARLDVFTRSLLGFLELAPPVAIHWRPSQQIVNPIAYLRAAKESPAALFFAGAVNVRLFNIQGAAGEMVMDTMGLAALGLPDLQCHFVDLEPGEVARTLYNLSLYIFEQGDIIEDGHTVDGAQPGSKWRAQHEDALIEPNRVVLDLDPGPPNAAGQRA
jgi:uncharacterized protein DUF4261